MTAKRLSVKVLSLVSLVALVGSTGCEVTTCDEGEDCVDLDWDGGFGFGEDDGSTAVDMDGGGDSGEPNQGPDGGGNEDTTPLADPEAFCTEQLEVGLMWATVFDACCGTVPLDATGFLTSVLLYPDDAFNRCVNAAKAPITANKATFDGAKAQECADAFKSFYARPPVNYDELPSSCPDAGFDLIVLEGSVGHGAPSLRQIPACRAAFAGKAGSGEACADHFECSGDLRCRAMSGSGAGTNKACLPPVGNGGTCASAGECDDDFVCIGLVNKDNEGVCRPRGELGAFSAECGRSSQCEEGLLCDQDYQCVSATGGDPVCGAMP